MDGLRELVSYMAVGSMAFAAGFIWGRVIERWHLKRTK